MTAEELGDPLVEFLSEPVILLRRGGEILQTNAGARRMLGEDCRSRNLFEFVLSPQEEFDRYLSLCSGTTTPLIGAAVLRNGNAGVSTRLQCARLRGMDGDLRLGMRCLPKREENFSLLTRRIRDLNLLLREGLREKALLEEALNEKTVLMRELQHRVKNNIQMMMSLITMSARGKESPLLTSFVHAARLRLQAMASAQEAIYRSQDVGSIEARPFLESLVQSIICSTAPAADLQTQFADVDLPSETAHALSLIVNELVTNAAKHGLAQGRGTISVVSELVGPELRLIVHDSGAGFEPDAIERSSGLRLVRGLCRQIGASFDVRAVDGTRCTISFRY